MLSFHGNAAVCGSNLAMVIYANNNNYKGPCYVLILHELEVRSILVHFVQIMNSSQAHSVLCDWKNVS